MLKILAGEYRSRRLIEPAQEEASRPYLARLRESVFGMLQGWFDDARVLDLFAGVGTVGLEAVSRGAAQVLMVERNRATYQHLVDNIKALGCEDRAEAMLGDALSPTVLARAPRPVDLLFVDPPYVLMEEEESRRQVMEQIMACRVLMADPSFLILRTPVIRPEEAFDIDGFIGPEIHHYGKDKHVLLYQPIHEAADQSGTGAASDEMNS